MFENPWKEEDEKVFYNICFNLNFISCRKIGLELLQNNCLDFKIYSSLYSVLIDAINNPAWNFKVGNSATST